MIGTRILLSLTALAALGACAGGTDQRVAIPAAEISERQTIAFRSVALREVSLPSYAAGEEIFVADETGLLTRSGDVLWADDPSRAITLELSRHLATITGVRIASEPWPFDDLPQATVELRIEEMLARADGMFHLSGQYFVSSETGRSRAEIFDLRTAIDGETETVAIAAARGSAVRELALKIARDGLR